jgi:hypothetical protein
MPLNVLNSFMAGEKVSDKSVEIAIVLDPAKA